MTDIHIDFADKNPDLPEYSFVIRCPDHPDLQPEVGYGLAGGGLGPYTVCEECSRILSKTVTPDDDY